MATNGLPVDRIVSVDVNLSPTAAQFPNLQSCLVLGTSTVIDTVTRVREYSDIGDVATDFGTTAEEFLAAEDWFAQEPQPETLLIGRWVKTASAGQLLGGPLSAANQLITAWTAIVAGSIEFIIDGGAPKALAALNFGEVTNLNAVAAIITTALAGAATVVFNPTFERFEVTSAAAGVMSSVAFAGPTGAGVDISAMMALTATSSGAFAAPGLAAETALAAVTLLDNMFSSQFYGVDVPSGSDADHLAVAAFVEAANPPHFYSVTTQEGGVLIASDTSDIAFQLANGKFNKTAVQYSSTDPNAAISMLARILTTNWNAEGSTITLKFKQEPGVTPELLTTDEADSIAAKNCNVLAGYNDGTANLQEGVSSSGLFIDEVIGIDWLKGQIQVNQYNVLRTLPKVPQTDSGMHLLATAAEAAMKAGVNNNLLAPGVWNAAGFGQIQTGDFLPKGYYIFQPPIASQAQADRAARKSVPFQIAAKTAGGVHVVFNILNVNA
jgi:hypothetical protein